MTPSRYSANFSMAAARGGSGTCSVGSSAGPVALQHLAGDGDLVHLVRAVVDAGGAGVAVHRLERQVGGVAERAVDLDGPVDHVVEHLGAPELDHADLDAGVAVVLAGGVQLVHLPRRVQREQAGRLHLGVALGDQSWIICFSARSEPWV